MKEQSSVRITGMSVRWGILGCGDIARKSVAKAIAADPNSRLVAACRRTKSKLDFVLC